MEIVIPYALGVFLLSMLSIWLLRRWVPALLIVASWTLLGPVLMQVANYLLVGYLDPFWMIAAFIQAVVALAASVGALGLLSALERDPG